MYKYQVGNKVIAKINVDGDSKRVAGKVEEIDRGFETWEQCYRVVFNHPVERRGTVALYYDWFRESQLIEIPSFSPEFEQEIISLAKQIAWNNRESRSKDWVDPNTPELQHVGTLEQNFNKELKELREVTESWDEIPDVTYYAVCLNAYGSTLSLEYVVTILPKLFGVSIAQIEAATLAKYRIRASGAPKDIMAEREAILAAVANA